MVATYAWWKGHRTFIEAAAQLVNACARPLRFYVVGGPIYAAAGSQTSVAQMRVLLDRYGLGRNVGLVPFQREIAPVYRGLDIAVHASERAEPFGRTIVEAMASARAVVVSRAGGAAELFQEGKSGLGFQPGDSRDLARVLGVLIGDDAQRERLAAEAAREATTRFDRNRLAGEVVATYRALLGTG
jgi:glycosyltransferase involved in cell wall biosynthesis